MGGPTLPWSVTYGKPQIAREDGTWTVAEIELVRRLREAGWRAGWVDTFASAPKAWAQWLVRPSALPSALRASYEASTSAAARGRGGKPDIVAWRGETLAEATFVELNTKGRATRFAQVRTRGSGRLSALGWNATSSRSQNGLEC